MIQQDINGIALDLREVHKDDLFSVPEDNLLEDFLQTVEETASPDSDPEQAAMAFICKRIRLNYGTVRRGKEVAEKDCTEAGLAEKSNSTAGKKMIEQQLRISI